jgi:hypothetical protein
LKRTAGSISREVEEESLIHGLELHSSGPEGHVGFADAIGTTQAVPFQNIAFFRSL